MTNLLDDLATDTAIEDSGDVLGGRGPMESGLYDMVITMAFMDLSSGGAKSVNLTFEDKNKKQLRITEYVTSGTAKGTKNYYEKDGVKKYLPGFNSINSIAQLTVGKELGALDGEEKFVEVWDFDEGKMMPHKKFVLTELLGQTITVGVLKQVEDKNVKTDAGTWVPSGDTKTLNVIGKSFRASDGKTLAEIKAEAPAAEFKDQWATTYTGVTINRAKGVKKGGVAAAAGAAGINTTPGAATKSLFP